MKVVIRVPTRAEILNRAQPIPISHDREPWSPECLGRFANASGVYVHCTGKKILYIGKTTRGNYSTFGERLKREFHKQASGDSSLHRLLKSQKKVKTAFFSMEDVERRAVAKGLSREDLVLVFERALIVVHRPIANSPS